jgi:hypothetical protein
VNSGLLMKPASIATISFSQDESAEPTFDSRLLRFKNRKIPACELDIRMEDLSRGVDQRNLPAVIEALWERR